MAERRSEACSCRCQDSVAQCPSQELHTGHRRLAGYIGVLRERIGCAVGLRFLCPFLWRAMGVGNSLYYICVWSALHLVDELRWLTPSSVMHVPMARCIPCVQVTGDL